MLKQVAQDVAHVVGNGYYAYVVAQSVVRVWTLVGVAGVRAGIAGGYIDLAKIAANAESALQATHIFEVETEIMRSRLYGGMWVILSGLFGQVGTTVAIRESALKVKQQIASGKVKPANANQAVLDSLAATYNVWVSAAQAASGVVALGTLYWSSTQNAKEIQNVMIGWLKDGNDFAKFVGPTFALGDMLACISPIATRTFEDRWINMTPEEIIDVVSGCLRGLGAIYQIVDFFMRLRCNTYTNRNGLKYPAIRVNTASAALACGLYFVSAVLRMKKL